MEDNLSPFENHLQVIEEKIRQETLPEKIEKLPESKKREVILSLASIAVIREAIKLISEGKENLDTQKQEPLYLQYPFINHLVSSQLDRVEKTVKGQVEKSSIQLLPNVIQQLQNREFLQACYRELGIKGQVDIDFTTLEQQNSARLLTSLLEKIIWIQINQESLNALGASVMSDIKEEPEPIQEFYENVLSSKQDFSGIDYLKMLHIPQLREAYLQSLASQSSPKLPPGKQQKKK